MLSSVTFVIVSGAYFDARTIESQALLAVLDAELAAGDLPVLLQKVLDISCQTFQASVGAILLHEPETTQLQIASSVGFEAPLPEKFRVQIGIGFSGKIAATGEPNMILDNSVDSGVLTPVLRGKDKTLWGVPLKPNG